MKNKQLRKEFQELAFEVKDTGEDVKITKKKYPLLYKIVMEKARKKKT